MQRSLTMIILACALFLKALVPTGWMPAPEQGAFAIQRCPAADPVPTMQMHLRTHADHDAHHKGQHDSECSFSPLLAGFATADLPALIQPPLAGSAASISLPSALDRKTGPPAPPPPATGPPLTA